MKLRVVIADDELLARKRLSRLLGAMADVELVASCDGVEALIDTLRREPADVVLLDIRMPGLSGLDAAGLLPEPAPRIIYVTAYRDHAVEAFGLGAADYVLKPVDPARLRQAFERVRSVQPRSLARLALSTSQGVVLLDSASITHLSFDGTLVTLFPRGAAPVMTELTLAELERRLPADFERVHRRHIVNLSHVERLVPTEASGYLAIIGDAQVPVSRQAARRLRTLLEI